jgi:hypothetical protein
MKYARIINSIAIDVRTDSPEGCFTPNIVAEFVEVPDQVEEGWSNKRGTWTAPVPFTPEPAAVVPPTVSPIEFMLLFTAQERVAIKAARASDEIIEDFMSIVEDPRLTGVNLALQSTQNALEYLVFKGLITEDRKAQIVLGKVM